MCGRLCSFDIVGNGGWYRSCFGRLSVIFVISFFLDFQGLLGSMWSSFVNGGSWNVVLIVR